MNANGKWFVIYLITAQTNSWVEFHLRPLSWEFRAHRPLYALSAAFAIRRF